MSDDVVRACEALREGDQVTVIDLMGARFAGSVLARKPGESKVELGIRRSTGVPHWIPYDRIVAVERG